MPHLVDIHRHPVKSFTAESLAQAHLSKGGGLPYDRHFAFVSGNKQDQPVPGQWVQPRTFLILTFSPELARFDCALTDEDRTLRITDPEGRAAEATRGDPASFEGMNAMLRAHFEHGPHGDIRLIEQANALGNWDFADSEISIINLATVRVISRAVGRDLEKERFRGNLYIDGLEAWEEFSWPGSRIRVGDAELDVLRPIQRCAMTSTEPGTGVREIDLPKAMTNAFGHQFCGVYAKVRKSGAVAVRDNIDLFERDAFNPHENLPERVSAPNLWPRFVEGGDWDSGYALYGSRAKNWPLLPANPGQSIRTHPLVADDAPRKDKVSHSDHNGWFVPRQTTLGPLVSGPYGRAK